MKSPCFKCEKRTAGCHSECKEYALFAEHKKKVREHNRKEGDTESYIYHIKRK